MSNAETNRNQKTYKRATPGEVFCRLRFKRPASLSSKDVRYAGDALKWRTEQVGGKHSGRYREVHGLTVGQYIDQWLAIKAQKLRQNSLRMYKQYLNGYAKPEIGHIKLSRLRPSHIENMQAALLARVSATTTASVRVLLGGALKKAVRLGLIPVNPVAATDAPKKNKPVMYALSPEEALAFIEACDSSRFGLYFQLMLSTGLRPEEGTALQWQDLELRERGVCNVRRVIHRLVGGGWKWDEPKSKSGFRSIVFPAELAAQLQEHRVRQLESKLKAGSHWQNHDLVFCTSIGSPLPLANLTQDFKQALAAVGLPRTIRLYDLRHSFVTISLIAGVDAKTVSADAGHASVAFTLDHYGHVLKEMREAASDKREELLKTRATLRAKG